MFGRNASVTLRLLFYCRTIIVFEQSVFRFELSAFGLFEPNTYNLLPTTYHLIVVGHALRFPSLLLSFPATLQRHYAWRL